MTIQKIIAALAAIMAMASANAAETETTVPVTSLATQKTEFIYYEGNNTCKYVYNLDEQGRVASKIRYTLNDEGKWSPFMAYSVHYGDDETIVTCAGWNAFSHTFTKNAKQIRLNAKEYPVAIHMPE